ncbi:MAG: PAS domain-containing protein [Planctomycetes bacterium]|nr:PAS domain-containing protein [Planctomycetota bacterium]
MSDGNHPAGAGAARVTIPPLVVGIGASAGGLQALETFFSRVAPDSPMAFLVVQHLSPEHESLMPELLEKHTRLSIHRVRDGMTVERGSIYVISPGYDLTYEAGCLRQRRFDSERRLHLPVDVLFSSLARELGDRAVGVVLSGSGSDGMRGVRAIKEAGGFVLAQDPDEATFDGMPISAQSTGLVDVVLPARDIPAAIDRIAQGLGDRDAARAEARSEATPSELLRILKLIERSTGRDFSGYKRSTILRRVERRMHLRGLSDLGEFADLLEQDPDETGTLHRDFLISVTRFFRDTDAFELLRRNIVPQLLRDLPQDSTLRVWCAGCATGEEAYSLAMLIVEAAEELGTTRDVRIFATDVDDEALSFAGGGLYPKSIVADVSPERLERFFVHDGDDYRIAKSLRARVIFAPHDLMADPPLTSMQLISCRNLLIYLDKPLQDRALRNLGYALRPGGCLFLGPSESLAELAYAFEPIERKWKLFRRTANSIPLQPGFGRFSAGAAGAFDARMPRTRTSATAMQSSELEEILRVVLEQLSLNCVVVDRNGVVLHVLGDVGKFLRLQTGRAQMDLHHLASRELEILLGAAMRRAEETGKEVVYRGPLGRESAEDVAIRVTPHLLRGREQVFLIAFESMLPRGVDAGDATEEIGAGRERLQVLEEELRHTRENLQAMIEELETSNEELQATNEELMSSNEELHAMNEELQSVNEELHTVNAEYQKKIQELTQLKDDVDNLLRSTRIGTLFLDESLRIRSFTPSAVRHVSLLHQDIGRPIEHLSSHLLGIDLRECSQRVLETGESLEVTTPTSDGGQVLARFLPYLSDGEAESDGGVVVTFVDVTELQRVKENLQVVVDSMPGEVALLDEHGRIVLVNRGWRDALAEDRPDDGPIPGLGRFAVRTDSRTAGDGPDRDAALALHDLLAGRRQTLQIEYERASTRGPRAFVLHATRVGEPVRGAVVTHLDVTDAAARERG